METFSQERVCKAKAAEFLKEREILNDAAATAWCYDYAGMVTNAHDKIEFWCWTVVTYSRWACSLGAEKEYAGAYITESTDVYEKITDKIKTLWKDIKTEDENENDTITALILGIMRIESRGEMENNYLSIHEAIVSPEHYDIETKRSERLLILLGNKIKKPRLEITIDNADCVPRANGRDNIRYFIHPPLFSYTPYPKMNDHVAEY